MIELMKATSRLTTDELSLNFRDSRLQQIGKFCSAKSVSTVGINESAQNLGFRRCGAAAKSENDRGLGTGLRNPSAVRSTTPHVWCCKLVPLTICERWVEFQQPRSRGMKIASLLNMPSSNYGVSHARREWQTGWLVGTFLGRRLRSRTLHLGSPTFIAEDSES